MTRKKFKRCTSGLWLKNKFRHTLECSWRNRSIRPIRITSREPSVLSLRTTSPQQTMPDTASPLNRMRLCANLARGLLFVLILSVQSRIFKNYIVDWTLQNIIPYFVRHSRHQPSPSDFQYGFCQWSPLQPLGVALCIPLGLLFCFCISIILVRARMASHTTGMISIWGRRPEIDGSVSELSGDAASGNATVARRVVLPKSRS